MTSTSLPRTSWSRGGPAAAPLTRTPRPGAARPAAGPVTGPGVRPVPPSRPTGAAPAGARPPAGPVTGPAEPTERAVSTTGPEAAEVEATRSVGEFFRRYAVALDALDLPAVAGAHAEPTFVVTDDGGEVVNRRAEVVTFFRGVLGEYRDRALVSAVPDVEGVDVLTEHLLDAVVRWSYADADGRVAVVDRYRYTLRREGRHRLVIQTTLVLDPPRVAG